MRRRACRQGQTWARRTETAAGEVHAHLLDSPLVHADKWLKRVAKARAGGLHYEGKRGWVWILRSPEVSLFDVDLSRSAKVFDTLMPVGRFMGVLVSDFYAVYTRCNDLLHSYCGAHLLRKAKEIAVVDTSDAALHFAATLSWLYERGSEACQRAEVDRVDFLS